MARFKNNRIACAAVHDDIQGLICPAPAAEFELPFALERL